ncbi:MAG: histidine phosphatase family protein [Thermoanaerobacteraceae bacterium]|nr:histidine phosphatase family protein [Thermoanaerobacteraceae bacterium]
MKLFIVRHGTTDWNKNNKIQGCLDIPLSEEGIKQGYLLANKLKKFKIDYIFSSDLSRARDTAKIISDILDLSFTEDHRLREMHFGEWQGLSFEQIAILDQAKLSLWRNHPAEVIFSGGESIDRVKKRALEFIKEIYPKYKCNNVLLVTHGSFIKILILSLLNTDLNLYKNLKQDNTALNIVEINNEGKSILQLFNDTCYF